MTALAEAIEKASGISKAMMPVYMTALAYIAAGGNAEQWARIFDLAMAKSTNDDAKALMVVSEKTTTGLPSASSPQANGNGQVHAAQPRPTFVATLVRPPLNLTGAISLGAKNVLAQSVFERVKTSDGRAWGEVGAHELDGMYRDGAMAKALKDKIGVLTNSQRFMKISELMTPDRFEQARNEAHGS